LYKLRFVIGSIKSRSSTRCWPLVEGSFCRRPERVNRGCSQGLTALTAGRLSDINPLFQGEWPMWLCACSVVRTFCLFLCMHVWHVSTLPLGLSGETTKMVPAVKGDGSTMRSGDLLKVNCTIRRGHRWEVGRISCRKRQFVLSCVGSLLLCLPHGA